MTEDPNEYQIGGSHYCGARFQVWDFIALNGIPFLEGNAIKYVARSRTKHPTPTEDIRKAIHYVTKIKQLRAEDRYLSQVLFYSADRYTALVEEAERLCRDNELNHLESRVVVCLATWAHPVALDRILEMLQVLSGAHSQP